MSNRSSTAIKHAARSASGTRCATNRRLPGRPQRRPLAQAISALLLSGSLIATAQAGADGLDLATLSGADGFRIDGAAASENSGGSVSAAGDINGDGIDDVLIGAAGNGPDDERSGRSYVVFGTTGGFDAAVALSDLDGSDGFRLDGAPDGAYSGRSVSTAGDINGDGIDDLIIGAPYASQNGALSGSSYVVFGNSTGFAATLDLSSLDGANGFRIDGTLAFTSAGFAVSNAGDINGDGIDDLIIGASGTGPDNDLAGSSYVVFGRTSSFNATLALADLDGGDGFRLEGEATGDGSGFAVSGAGDINGDGVDDLIIGSPFADPNGGASGSSYVVFGKTSEFEATLALSGLDGENGFRLDGEAAEILAGASVSGAGDVNGDGIDDLIIGAQSSFFSELSSGGYVVFGRNSAFAASINLSSLDGSTGFRFEDASEGSAGASVSGAGDINGDGIDDLIVGAPEASTNGGGSGASYLVFGKRSGFDATIDLSSLSAGDGLRFDGMDPSDNSGSSVSAAGDIDGDGIGDLIIGSPRTGPILQEPGSSHVVFGVRDRLFGGRFDSQNIQTFFPRLDARVSFRGSGVRWDNGATCDCDFAPFDFNLYRSGSNLAFFWPRSGTDGAVADESGYVVLQPGDIVGPESDFSASAEADATADWRAGVDGYLGFRFIDPDSGRLRYGYARIRTTAPNGYPAELIEFSVNLSGAAITIPSP